MDTTHPRTEPRAEPDRAPVDTTRVEARALADATRLRILRHLVEAGHPVDIEELTRVADVHHNAVRSHLHRLVAAGLAVEGVQRRTGRGRPRLQYTADPTAVQRLGGGAGHEQLARALSRTLAEGRSPREQGIVEGAAVAATLSPGLGLDPVAAIERWARGQGVSVRATQDPRDASIVTLQLDRCPYAEVAAESPEVVCALHLGTAEGLVEATGGRIDGLEPADPLRGGCALRVRR